jgi:hypothetical protein
MLAVVVEYETADVGDVIAIDGAVPSEATMVHVNERVVDRPLSPTPTVT